MNKKIIFFTLFLSIIFVFFTPFLVFAQAIGPGDQMGGGQVGPSQPIQIPNPLGDDPAAKDPRLLLGRIIGAILGIVGSVALILFIYGGVLWMTSAGNQERVRKGKEVIIWAVLGLGIIFTSYAVVKFIITAFVGTGTK